MTKIAKKSCSVYFHREWWSMQMGKTEVHQVSAIRQHWTKSRLSCYTSYSSQNPNSSVIHMAANGLPYLLQINSGHRRLRQRPRPLGTRAGA